ncbi:MAG: hypothetical protein JNL32_08310 [Candidatus Kapabacteria bacterium]|nr:hypothetical protein [Candidatus Kapabacteria bacterium]
MTISTSTNLFDYEILIRRYDMADRYASYCPQLQLMIKGTAHEEVENAMKDVISKHIADLKAAAPDND